MTLTSGAVIQDGSVTTAKLANSSVTWLKLSGIPKSFFHKLVASASDQTYSSTGNLATNFNLYKDVVINTGVVLTCTQKITFLVCKSLTLNGTANLTTRGAGAASGATAACSGTVGNVAGNPGAAGFNGAGGAGSSGATAGLGGAGGASDNYPGGTSSGLYQGGSAAIFGVNLAKRKLQSIIPWHLMHQITTETFYGSGGATGSCHSGGETGAYGTSPAPPNGAGALFILCETLTIASGAKIDADGGNASNASASSGGSGFGGAGGPSGSAAGYLWICADTCVGTGTLSAKGGNGGNGAAVNSAAGGGAGSNGGLISLYTNTAVNPFTLTITGGIRGLKAGASGTDGANGNAGEATFYAIAEG